MVFSQILKLYRNNPRITKADKDFGKRIDFKGIKHPVKLETFTKSKTKIPSAFSFLVMKIKKNIQYVYTMLWRKKIDLLFIGEGEKKH